MRDVIVLGERCGDIADDLRGLKYTFHPGEMAEVNGKVQPQGSLVRAWCRAEAELLLADADAMAAGRYDQRTPAQRRSAAFTLIIERFVEAVGRMTRENGTGHDPRAGMASDQKRRSA